MVTVTLDPVAQSYGRGADFDWLAGGLVVDSSVTVGGGSVSDGSDASYVEMGTWEDGDGVDHIEPLSCKFVLPSGYANPTAVALKVRMRTDPEVISDPPEIYANSFAGALVIDADDTVIGSSSRLLRFAVVNGSLPTTVEPSFWWNEIDPDDPTDPGGWFEFAADASGPGGPEALVGSGLRMSLAIYAGSIFDTIPRRRPWLDIFKVQLLVACDVAATGTFPLRRYPPVNNGGSGPTRHYPRSPGRRGAY